MINISSASAIELTNSIDDNTNINIAFSLINLLSLKDFRAWFLSNLRRVQFSVPGQMGMSWANVELKVA